MGWIDLIVPIAAVIIIVGVVIVAWFAIRGRGQMSYYRVAKPPKSLNRHINPKTGSRF